MYSGAIFEVMRAINVQRPRGNFNKNGDANHNSSLRLRQAIFVLCLVARAWITAGGIILIRTLAVEQYIRTVYTFVHFSSPGSVCYSKPMSIRSGLLFRSVLQCLAAYHLVVFFTGTVHHSKLNPILGGYNIQLVLSRTSPRRLQSPPCPRFPPCPIRQRQRLSIRQWRISQRCL